MKYINPTRQTPPTEAQLAARQAFFEESQRNAAALSAQLTATQNQIQQARFQEGLVEATQLSLEQLVAIRTWLQNNP
jgi:hypothetical protein